jgi:hypothetical protein
MQFSRFFSPNHNHSMIITSDNIDKWTQHSRIFKLPSRYSSTVLFYTGWSKGLCAHIFLWDAMKNSVYSNNPHTTDDLKTDITEYIRNVDRAILKTVFENTVRRVNKLIRWDSIPLCICNKLKIIHPTQQKSVQQVELFVLLYFEGDMFRHTAIFKPTYIK